MRIHATEHKSVGELRRGNAVRVFVDNDYTYGYFVDETSLFALLTTEQQTQYLQGAEARLDVTEEVAQSIIDMGATPYAKPTVYRK